MPLASTGRVSPSLRMGLLISLEMFLHNNPHGHNLRWKPVLPGKPSNQLDGGPAYPDQPSEGDDAGHGK